MAVVGHLRAIVRLESVRKVEAQLVHRTAILRVAQLPVRVFDTSLDFLQVLLAREQVSAAIDQVLLLASLD